MPADVDVLERERQPRTRLAGDGQERVQVRDDDVDRAQTVPCQLLEVAGIVAQRQDAAVHGGMQRLDSPAEHLRESGDLLHAADVDARFAQQTFSSAGREELDAECFEPASKVHDARLVVDRQDRSHREPSRSYHARNSALDSHAILGEGAHRVTHQAVLLLADARVQRLDVVSVADLDAPLKQDRPAVQVVGDQVHGAAGDFDAVRQGFVDGVQWCDRTRAAATGGC